MSEEGRPKFRTQGFVKLMDGGLASESLVVGYLPGRKNPTLYHERPGVIVRLAVLHSEQQAEDLMETLYEFFHVEEDAKQQ